MGPSVGNFSSDKGFKAGKVQAQDQLQVDEEVSFLLFLLLLIPVAVH